MRRSGRATDRAALRLGVRALVIGGFAGAAWLLSAASAQGAQAPGPVRATLADLPIVSLIDDPGTGVDEQGADASRELDAVLRPASKVTDLALPTTSVARSTAAQSTMLDDSAVRQVTDPVAAPLDGLLRPVTGAVRTAAEPVTSTVRSADRTFSRSTDRRVGNRSTTSRVNPDRPDDTVSSQANQVIAGPVAAPQEQRAATANAGSTPADRPEAGTPPRVTAWPPARDGGRNPSEWPLPASPRGVLGAGAGMPVGGPAPHLEGGAFALVPSPVVESTVALHRLPVTTDVVVPRQDAEAPTVSPD